MSDEQATDTMDQKTQAATGFDKLLKLTLVQFLVAVTVLALWAATDSWYLLTDLTIASFLSVATAFVAGVIISTLIHEWFHFFGAIFSGASYSIPDKIGLFVFNFDFEKNSLGQFLSMSAGGQLGGVLAVLLIYMSMPIDSSGRVMLVSAAIGSAVFAGLVEWPVIMRTRQSKQPREELAKINKAGLYRSSLIGVVVAAGIWTVAS